MRLAVDAELLGEDGERVPVELGVEQQRRLERVEPLVSQRRRPGAAGAGRQVLAVEADVVADDDRVADEVAHLRVRLREAGRAAHVLVADPRRGA